MSRSFLKGLFYFFDVFAKIVVFGHIFVIGFYSVKICYIKKLQISLIKGVEKMLETLPNWFWALYYLFFLATFGTAIFSVVKNKHRGLSILTIVFTVTIPIISLINSIGRVEGMNEFEHLFSQLQQGAVWSIYTVIGYIFLLVWWVLILFKSKSKNQVIVSN